MSEPTTKAGQAWLKANHRAVPTSPEGIAVRAEHAAFILAIEAEAAQATAREAALRDALEFYAEARNWETWPSTALWHGGIGGQTMTCPIADDHNGECARRALAALQEQEPQEPTDD